LSQKARPRRLTLLIRPLLPLHIAARSCSTSHPRHNVLSPAASRQGLSTSMPVTQIPFPYSSCVQGRGICDLPGLCNRHKLSPLHPVRLHFHVPAHLIYLPNAVKTHHCLLFYLSRSRYLRHFCRRSRRRRFRSRVFKLPTLITVLRDHGVNRATTSPALFS
jgi:hypothetical protein